jgi:hypothetical protein
VLPDARRAGMLLLLLAAPVGAQFVQLATTDDGGRVFFTTPMSLKGAGPSRWRESRLYRFGADGLTLFAERDPLAPESKFEPGYGVRDPSVSADGAVVGLTYTGICVDRECVDRLPQTEVRGRQTVALGPGRVQVSRNGRWALVEKYPMPMRDPLLLVDLSTGQPVELPPDLYRVGTGLSSDGSFLAAFLRNPAPYTFLLDPPGIWKGGQLTPLVLPEGLRPIALTADGAAVLAVGSPNRLAMVSLASNTAVTIAEAPDFSRIFTWFALSNNGRRALYAIGSQTSLTGPAYVWDSDTGTGAPIPLEPGEAPSAATLSGDGSIAFLATNHNRIVRYDVASRTATPMFPQTPYCEIPPVVASGSLTRLHCSFSGAPADLTGKLAFDGIPAPIVSSTADEIAIQVPWRRVFFVRPLARCRERLALRGEPDSHGHGQRTSHPPGRSRTVWHERG